MTTDEVIATIQNRILTGENLEELLERLDKKIVDLSQELALNPDREETRRDVERLNGEVQRLTELGQARLEELRTEVRAQIRKGSLHRLYGLTPE